MTLSLIIWMPIATALLLFLAPVNNARLARWVALIPMLVVLLLAGHVFSRLGGGALMDWDPAFSVACLWVGDLGIGYHLAVSRLSAMLILLTALAGTAAIAVSSVEKNARHFYALGLLMVGGMAGAFASVDLFFFYIFHEFALIPTFLLVGIWGGEHRRRAAMKITLYLGLASLVLLVGLIALYLATGGKTFNLVEMKQLIASGAGPDPDAQILIFGLLFLGFGTLVAVVPFHTWAPMGYGEAPALAAMLHAGVIKKFGLYGLMVVAAPLLPEGFQYWTPVIIGLGAANLVYGGYVAMQQKDLRYMLAYASVSHMGYAFLALASGTAIATQGFVLFLFAHGLTAALGFGVAGWLREQTGTSVMAEMGGLAKRMPFLAAIFTMTALAGFGLPGFASFPAELMIFFGSFEKFPWATVLAVWTTVISAIYLLRAVRSLFLGPLPERWMKVADAGGRIRMALILLMAALLMAGFWPRSILGNAPDRLPVEIASLFAKTFGDRPEER